MDCNCFDPQWPADELLMRYQYISDVFIAIAYFSIPIELVYFVQKSTVFPYRWVLVQFGAFIVLCGATHLINLWTSAAHTRTVAIVMTTTKVFTAVVSCTTALMLVHIIPDLLSVKTRELFLKNKAAELDREMGLIRTQEETGRYVRMLTHEIRSTLDRHTILRTTLVELGRALALESALSMPTQTGLELQLSYTLHHQNPVGFTINDWPELSTKRYALMVLMLPSDSARQWHVHELELVEVVADQVAVALSHAAILAESMRARDLLMEQNVALDLARREAETAGRARNDFLAVMNREMRTPMHAISALSSLMQESDLTPEQRLMVETILKSSNLLVTLINDVLDLSRLEDGSLQLDVGTFNLHALFREVLNLIKPIASVKKLFVTLSLSSGLPEFAIVDEKHLLQILLNVVGNAVKFSKEGSVSVSAVAAKSESLRGPRAPEFFPVQSENHFYLRVQAPATKSSGGTGLGLAICKRFVNLMEGHIWIESEGLGKGSTAIFIVKLAIPGRTESKLPFMPKLPSNHMQQTSKGLKVLVMDDNGFSRMEHKVVFMDVRIPGIDCYDVAVSIHEKFGKRHGRPLIVALTGNTDRVTKENCMRVGMDGVILKPVSVEKMGSVLPSF
ncbi:hypothetical protein RND71_037990 [Anisodus tanguticus]|uniref:histidine kinase n=1 Tax=Anisodus tanguticus TaxID=243964 RepID=A0AAE1UYS1_9SOLA|nr:hypothetical protein RND71_037990 [Anisodus tanguticus]